MLYLNANKAIKYIVIFDLISQNVIVGLERKQPDPINRKSLLI